jgi:HK97 family phage major capsid protein
MSKKKMELRNQMEALKAEARQLVEENKLEDAKAKTAELKKLKDQLDVLDDLDNLDPSDAFKAAPSAGELNDQKEQEQLYKNAFVKALKGKKLSADDRQALDFKNSLSENTDADGGLIVPKDVNTAINELKRSLIDLSQLATIEPVSTNSGTRALEKLATMTAFDKITDDTADISEMASPQFQSVSYAIEKYAGWLPIPNDLLKDTDQNLIAYINRWIAKKSVVTNNTLFMAILTALTESTFADWKAIKKALNVTLDPMHAVGATILTNQDGYQYLDTLTDSTGKPLLKDDITQPGGKILFGKPIVTAPNAQLATTGTTTKYAPMFIGDFKEGVVKFDRQTYEIASTNVGGTAFRKDRTEMRVIEREQYKAWDVAAIVRGKIDVTATV